MDRRTASETVNEMRKRGELLLYPFQNPDADVQLPPGAEPSEPESVTVDKSATTRAGAKATDTDSDDELDLPPLIDIRDALAYLDEHGPAEIGDDIREVRTLLKKVADRKMSQQEGVLDEIDNLLLRMELETESHAKEHCSSARTWIQLYRDAIKQSSDEMSVGSYSLRHAQTGHTAPIGALSGTDAEIRGEILNEGPPRDVIVVATFYDREHQTLSKARSHRIHVETDTERPFVVPAHVPTTARHYILAPLASDDFLAEYQFQ